MAVSVVGKVIEDSSTQLLKASIPIVLVAGMETLANFLQFWNAPSPMLASASVSDVIDSRASQP